MKESFIKSFVLNICKKDAYLHVNYFPYVQICVKITEDDFSIDRNLECTSKGVNDYIEFMLCSGKYIISVIN